MNVRLNRIALPLFVIVLSISLNSCLDDSGNSEPVDVQVLNDQIAEFEAYFKDNSINATKIGDGYYQVVVNEGTGEKIKGGEIVELKYVVRKFDTDQVIFFDSSYVLIPNNGFYVPNIVGNVTSLNYANTLLKEFGKSDFYLASTYLFGSSSGTFNNVAIAANQMIKANYEIVDIRTTEEQKEFENNLLLEKLTELELTAEPTETGLFTIVVEEGTGVEQVASASKINIDYKGTFLNGTEFDSGTGKEFVLSNLIEGWKQGLKDQKAGAKLILLIPSHLAYGPKGVISQGKVSIPSFEPLKFDITLNSFENL